MSKYRKTRLKISQDDYYELEVFRNDVPEVGISIGIHEGGLESPIPKRDEHVMSISNNDLDLLIDALIDLRYE